MGLATSPYAAFLATLPMRFYPINMLLFGLSSILLGRDFGPMLAAERTRALYEELLQVR